MELSEENLPFCTPIYQWISLVFSFSVHIFYHGVLSSLHRSTALYWVVCRLFSIYLRIWNSNSASYPYMYWLASSWNPDMNYCWNYKLIDHDSSEEDQCGCAQ
eukprot:393814_1